MVAVGAVAAAPFAAGGFAFHAVDDAVDDGRAFELGEHAEHLHHHPSGGVVVSKGSVARAKRDPGVVEAGQDVARPRIERANRSTR